MIDELKPYAAYRPSPDRWLTKFPSNWERVRIKYLLREVDRRTQTGEEPLLSMRRDHGLVPLSQFSDKVAEPKALLAYKLVRPGELVVNRMQAGNGLVFVARIPGLISPDYAIFRPIREVNLDYLELLFRSYTMRAKFRSESTGLGTGTAGFLRLYGDSLGAIEIGLPSPDEQSQIVRFLNHADRRIRRYIRGKKKLIALLNEQMQTVIHHAVTRGLHTGPRLKPSGVKWLRDVPQDWQVMPLRRVTLSRCDGPFGSGLKSAHYTDHGIRVVRLQNIGHAEFKASDVAFISPSHYATLGDHGVEAGDVLIAGLGDERHPAGRACVAPSSILPAMVKADCFRFRLNDQRLTPSFAALHLTATASDASAILSTGATRQRTNLESTASRQVLVPPLPEQLAIVQHLAAETHSSRRAVQDAESEIDLLRQYQSRLIADVVTGKIDVREAAASLPDISTIAADEPSATEDTSDSDAAELDEAEAEVGA